MRRVDGLAERPAPALRLAAGLLAMAVAALVGWAVWAMPSSAGLREAVLASMDRSGVTHPVTAVLLNFRGYDTLLEVAVLLIALVGTWSLRLGPAAREHDPPGLVLLEMVRLLVPLLVVLAGYLLWLGAHAPGGAFQAGALLAGAGVMLALTEVRPLGTVTPTALRLLASLSVAVFLAVALLVMGDGRRLLEYPTRWAGLLILLIESAATVAIGVTLAYLFLGDAPRRRAGKGTGA
jgi:multisubunit Na+/H+ antiporter MnhB subunit